MAYWFTARYDGPCKEKDCENEIGAGERAVMDEDKVYCASCGEDIAGPDPDEN